MRGRSHSCGLVASYLASVPDFDPALGCGRWTPEALYSGHMFVFAGLSAMLHMCHFKIRTPRLPQTGSCAAYHLLTRCFSRNLLNTS